MKKRDYRTQHLAELRELNATLRRIAAASEIDSTRNGLTDNDDLVGVEIDGTVQVSKWRDVKPNIERQRP